MSMQLATLESNLRDRLRDLLALDPPARQEIINAGYEARLRTYDAHRDQAITCVIAAVHENGVAVLAQQRPLDDLLKDIRADRIRNSAQPYPTAGVEV